MPVRNVIVIVLAVVSSLACHATAQRNHFASLVAEGMRIVSRFSLQEVSERQLFESAMNGMVQDIDPYSKYIGLDQYDAFQESLDQEFAGVGIVVEMNQETQRLTVVSPFVGTPAYKAGIQSGDTIMTIAGQSTEGMTMEAAVKLMRGKPGTTVDVEVQPPGTDQLLAMAVERAIIPVESVKGDLRKPNNQWHFVLADRPDIGYIRMETFGELTTQEMEDALREVHQQKSAALIIDLRNNSGGLLSAAVEISDMFVDSGEIVSTRGRDGIVIDRYRANEEIAFPQNIPIVLIVNQYSASATEILSACLQDNGRAAIVGQRTWGKGTVQNIFPFESGRSALKLTTASYWRPSGKNIHRTAGNSDDDEWGVSPDKGLEVEADDRKIEEFAAHRRIRDIVPRRDGIEVDREPQPKLLEIDTQLSRAVEHIDHVLSN